MPFRVRGTACFVFGCEQGLAAGELAHAILYDGVSPDTLEMAATVRGQPVINLGRAEDMGLTINSSLLLAAKVVTDYAWDEQRL